MTRLTRNVTLHTSCAKLEHSGIHHRRLTWNLRVQPWKRKIIFRFYVNVRGCISSILRPHSDHDAEVVRCCWRFSFHDLHWSTQQRSGWTTTRPGCFCLECPRRFSAQETLELLTLSFVFGMMNESLSSKNMYALDFWCCSNLTSSKKVTKVGHHFSLFCRLFLVLICISFAFVGWLQDGHLSIGWFNNWDMNNKQPLVVSGIFVGALFGAEKHPSYVGIIVDGYRDIY